MGKTGTEKIRNGHTVHPARGTLQPPFETQDSGRELYRPVGVYGDRRFDGL